MDTNITDEKKLQAELLPVALKLIKDINWNFIKFNNIFTYLGKKVTFRKVDAVSAHISIEGDGNDTTALENMVPEALQFFIDEIRAGNITEVIDYRKFITETVKKEGGHIKFTKKFKHNGREYTVNSIISPASNNASKGALIEYHSGNGDTRKDYVSNMDESMLSDISDVIKANDFI